MGFMVHDYPFFNRRQGTDHLFAAHLIDPFPAGHDAQNWPARQTNRMPSDPAGCRNIAARKALSLLTTGATTLAPFSRLIRQVPLTSFAASSTSRKWEIFFVSRQICNRLHSTMLPSPLPSERKYTMAVRSLSASCNSFNVSTVMMVTPILRIA